MNRSTIGTITLAATLALGGAFALPAGAVDVEAINKAATAADHEALASEYDQEAAAARKEAARHRSMAEAYASGVKYGKVPHSGKGSMKLHCERLVEHFEAQATEAEALAALHRQLAAEKK